MRNLWVCIPARNRTILTEKTIDSIYFYTTLFDKIYIYLFDNYTEIDNQRMNFIQRLINKNKIHYYSYCGEIATQKVFPKIMIHHWWNKMMETMLELERQKNEHYFVLCDNDVLFGPEWDSYVLTACQLIEKKFPKTAFITAFPGGIPTSGINNGQYVDCTNSFNNVKFKILRSKEGGSSSFWFMNKRMMKNLQWSAHHIRRGVGRFKTHDTEAWNFIKRKNPSVLYASAVKTDHPLLLHLGGTIGKSICNSYDPVAKKKQNNNNTPYTENEFEDSSVEEIYNLFKNKCNKW